MLYTDLASNDFSQLFKSMQGLAGDPADAYQALFDGVFVHGCGTGFHRQLAPSGSLDFGFSATAMHYVSEIPVDLKDHVHMTGASGAERAAFEAQAAAEARAAAAAHRLWHGELAPFILRWRTARLF